jgi:hypothetical protein
MHVERCETLKGVNVFALSAEQSENMDQSDHFWRSFSRNVGVIGLQHFCEGTDTSTGIFPVMQSLAYYQNNATTMVTEIQMNKAECCHRRAKVS